MPELALLGVGAGAGVIPNGMLARWTLDDTAAGYTDLIGGLTLAAAGTAPTTGTGIRGDAAQFGGAGNLVRAQTLPAGSFSVELWARPETLAGATTQTLIAEWNTGSSAQQNIEIAADSTTFYVFARNGAGGLQFPSLSGAANNVWHFLMLTYDDATGVLTISRNAGARQSVTLTGGLRARAAVTLTVGARLGTQTYFTGRLDELAIWNRALTSVEETARYAGGAGVRP